MALADEPRTGVLHPEQPTAPYLDAVWGYAFRGSTRFHVPGHKGGAGADPGLRSALGERALMLDVPADIHGIDLGPVVFDHLVGVEHIAADLASEAGVLRRSPLLGQVRLALLLGQLGEA